MRDIARGASEEAALVDSDFDSELVARVNANAPANARPALFKNPLRVVVFSLFIRVISGLLKVRLIGMATVFYQQIQFAGNKFGKKM